MAVADTEIFLHEHCQIIGLVPVGAAGAPDAQLAVELYLFRRRQELLGEMLEMLAFPHKVCIIRSQAADYVGHLDARTVSIDSFKILSEIVKAAVKHIVFQP